MKKLLFILSFASMTVIANAQWQQTSLDSGQITCFAKSGNNIFAGTQDNGVYLSSNNGSSWSAMNTGLNSIYEVFAIAIQRDTIFAGMGDGVSISSNNGNSWDTANTGLPSYYWPTTDSYYPYSIIALAISSNTIFASTFSGNPWSDGSHGVYMSSNNGQLWSACKDTDLTFSTILSFAIKGDTIFAGSQGSGVFKSSNNGNSWVAVNTGLTDTFVLSLAINNTNIFAGTQGGVFLSSNNGNSWVNIGLTGDTVLSLALKGDTIFAGTRSGGVYMYLNNGINWTAINEGLTNDTVTALTINGNYIFAGTNGGGVWKLPLSELGIAAIKNNASNISVYPNPVTTTLTIDIPKAAVSSGQYAVSNIAIYNLLGEKVYTLPITDNRSPITINVDDFPNGVYVVEVRTENGVEVRKIVKE